MVCSFFPKPCTNVIDIPTNPWYNYVGLLLSVQIIITRFGSGHGTPDVYLPKSGMALHSLILRPGYGVFLLSALPNILDNPLQGTPTAYFPDTNCDFPSHFSDHNIIINLTFCAYSLPCPLAFEEVDSSTPLLQVVIGLVRHTLRQAVLQHVKVIFFICIRFDNVNEVRYVLIFKIS